MALDIPGVLAYPFLIWLLVNVAVESLEDVPSARLLPLTWETQESRLLAQPWLLGHLGQEPADGSSLSFALTLALCFCLPISSWVYISNK